MLNAGDEITTTQTIYIYVAATDNCPADESSFTVTIEEVTTTCPTYEPVCIDDPTFILIGGTPAGGMYSGPGVIDNSDGTFNFDPIAAGTGMHTITYEYTDPTNGCGDNCMFKIEVITCVEETFCTYTKGFWGNPNGKHEGMTTLEILESFDLENNPVIIGVPGMNSITISSADCILALLPGGGPSKSLKGDATVPSGGDCDVSNAVDVHNNGEIKNGVVTQLIAFILNTRLDPALLDLTFESIESNIGDCFDIPSSIAGLQGVTTLEELIMYANQVLAGKVTGSLDDLNTIFTALNEFFDECRPFNCDDPNPDPGDGDCEEEVCQMAYAGDANSHCLDEFDGFGPIGWINEIDPGQTGVYELWASIDDCLMENGHKVGTLEISYDGDDMKFTYTLSDEECYFGSVKLFISCDKPTNPIQWTEEANPDGEIKSYTLVVDRNDYNDCTGDKKLCFIAYADVCKKDCDPEPEPEPSCGTGYAFGGEDIAMCFRDDADLTANRWGWTNKLSFGTGSWPIYVGAGQCDVGKGTHVGDLYYSYIENGEKKVMFQYHMYPGYELVDVHLYFGCAKYPVDRRGDFTVANGYLEYRPAITSGQYTTGEWLSVGNCETDDIYVIAHSVVCGDFSKDAGMIEPPAPIVVAPKTKKSKKKAKGKSITAPDVGQQSGFTTEVKVFPNPASSYLFVQFDDYSEGEHRVQLHDALGRFIKEYRLDVRPGERIRLDLPNLVQNGMYYLKVHNREQLKVVPIVVSKNVFDMRRN